MNLKEAIQLVRGADESAVVFARKPWAAQSAAVVSALDQDFRVPADLSEQGFAYFLERSIIEDLRRFATEKSLSEDQLFDAIIYYATYDAYPAWLNDFS